METFTQSDLVYHYQWSEYQPDDPRVSGEPDSTVFNRKEGWEVLFIINWLAAHLAWDVRSFGKKIELLIHDHLPEDLVRQDQAIQWIKENWK
ncbi:hypothetical protein [Desulfogranum japonicum]|uniref:hypothetical protein n=1 Tax=Desulfogranum japonicum TaxID=231447 RepID=UPI00041F7C23|nr:hypothetical protein [Desulfogranum japonicum]